MPISFSTSTGFGFDASASYPTKSGYSLLGVFLKNFTNGNLILVSAYPDINGKIVAQYYATASLSVSVKAICVYKKN